MFQEGEVVTCDHSSAEIRTARKDWASKVDEGLWHVLTIEPQHEGVAFAHLVARRFGCYLPELVTTEVIRGRKRDVHRPMFRGYLFVLVFGFEAHWRRIFACPGVTGVLMNGGHPAIVPDEAMRIIQAQEHILRNEVEHIAKPKKRWRKTRAEGPKPESSPIHISMTTYSALQCLNSLDDKGRVGALRKALGL